MIGSKNMEVNQGMGQGGTTKAVNMFSSLISQSSNFVMAGVKNLVVKKHNLPVTKIVDDIMEQKQGKFNDEYKYLDPKILRGNEGGQVPRTKTPFSDGIVFVVGGGNYIEYQNLQDYVKTKNMGHTPSTSKDSLYKLQRCVREIGLLGLYVDVLTNGFDDWVLSGCFIHSKSTYHG